MKRDWDEDEFDFLTYQVGDTSRPMSLMKSYVEGTPIRVFRSSNGNRVKGKYFPVSEDPKKVVYRYDGLYYIICAKTPDNKVVTKDMSSINARVFLMMRAGPHDTMEALLDKCPAAKAFIPSFQYCSKRLSIDLCSVVKPWDVNAFNDWNPAFCEL